MSILYVEDEELIRESLSKSLRRMSNNLHVAKDGKEGLELFMQYRPDIVVTDIKMPFMNGIEMSKSIRKINKEQAIIFTSAHSESGYLIDAIDMQVDGYILKPICLEQLESKIDAISKVHDLKHDLHRKHEQLIEAEKMASLGKMIGNIAHQWRQPLAVISATIAHINIEKELSSLSEVDLCTSCDKIGDTVQYLSDTIDDFRDYIKVDNVPQEFIMKDVIGSISKIIVPLAKTNFINIIEDDTSTIVLNTHMNHLKQALINILYNAKDAFDDSHAQKCIFISTIDHEHEIEIIIKDNAGGIDEDIIHNIFEPYFTTKHKSQGTGLGLYITYNVIANDLNGSIDIENEDFEYEGKSYTGAKFSIKIPHVENLLKTSLAEAVLS